MKPSLACVLNGRVRRVRCASASPRWSSRAPSSNSSAASMRTSAAGIGIHLAEERQLDLSWEETVLPAGEGAAVGLVHVALGDVGDEVPDHAHVEEQLPGPPPLVEREGLARPGEVHERRGTTAGLDLSDVADEGLARGGRGGGGRRRRLRLQRLEAFRQGTHRLLERLELLAERLDLGFLVLRSRRRGSDSHRQQYGDANECAHRRPLLVEWKVSVRRRDGARRSASRRSGASGRGERGAQRAGCRQRRGPDPRTGR